MIREDIAHQPAAMKRVWPLKIISPLVSKEAGLTRIDRVCLTAFLNVISSCWTPPGLIHEGIIIRREQKDID